MDFYVTSDLHFHHNNILKYGRTFNSVKDMDEALILEINSKVKQFDVVYHLGDFIFKRTDINAFYELFEQLNGKWIFILGNHDEILYHYKSQLLEHPRILKIEDYMTVTINNVFYILSHFEHRTWIYKDNRRIFKKIKNQKIIASHHFFGHYHSNPERVYDKNCLDVGIDATNLKLLTFDQQRERMI